MELESWLLTVAKEWGFDHFHYGGTFPESVAKPRMITLSVWPSQLLHSYYENDYYKYDQVISHFMSRSEPFTWDMLDFEKSPKESWNLQMECDSVGVRAGVSVIHRGSSGEQAVLTFSADQDRNAFSVHARKMAPYVQQILLLAHRQVCRLYEGLKSVSIQLTVREKQCLVWAADGKTSAEIATILAIGAQTVVQHLTNATNKLGVSSRQHAISKVLSHRLLEFWGESWSREPSPSEAASENS